MAGRNQHHIPQFHQRAFGIPTEGKPKSIWLYEQGKLPEVSAIEATAADHDFYSEPAVGDNVTLDDKITDKEDSLSRVIAKLRTRPCGDKVQAAVASRIIFEMGPRTLHLRATIARAAVAIGEMGATIMSSSAAVQRLTGLDGTSVSDLFRSKLTPLLTQRPEFALLNLPVPVMEQVAFTIAKEQFNHFFDMSGPIAALAAVAEGSELLARDTHIKALNSIIDNGMKRTDLLELHWTIEAAGPQAAVMPDCIALGYENDGSVHPFTILAKNKLAGVVMPISSSRLLVGRRPGAPLFALDGINGHAAACSHRFFGAASPDPAFAELIPTIGSRSFLGVDEAFQNVFGEYLPTDSRHAVTETDLSGQPRNVRVSELPPVRPHSYQVTFRACADPETAQEIANALMSVTNELSRMLPLERLDGITFASDYATALGEVDRGVEGIKPADTVPADVGVGVAKTVIVKRDGVVKGRIVFASWVGHACIANDEATVRAGLHLVVNQLAQVAMTEWFDTALPGVMFSPIADHHDGWAFACVSSAPDSYAAARISAPYGSTDDLLSMYRDHVIEAIDRAYTRIPEARLAYRYHGDLDKLLAVVAPLVRHILEFSAVLLGHCDALGLDPLDGESKLAATLKQRGLAAWLSVFRADLQAFYERLGKWESFDEFLAFNRHVERLLWPLGLFPWRNEEGTARVEVPLIIDALALQSADKDKR